MGWESAINATEEVVLDKLRQTYWNGVHREVCNMILSYRELSRSLPESYFQVENEAEVPSEGFRNILSNWSQY